MDDTEQHLQGEFEKGEFAKRCMEIFIDPFFDGKTEQLFIELKNVNLGDVATLEAIHHQVKSLNALRSDLQSYIDTGKMAELSLRELRKQRQQD